MTAVTITTDGNKKSITFGDKTYDIELSSDNDLSFMNEKASMDPIVEMLAKAYELGKGNQTVIFVQK